MLRWCFKCFSLFLQLLLPLNYIVDWPYDDLQNTHLIDRLTLFQKRQLALRSGLFNCQDKTFCELFPDTVEVGKCKFHQFAKTVHFGFPDVHPSLVLWLCKDSRVATSSVSSCSNVSVHPRSSAPPFGENRRRTKMPDSWKLSLGELWLWDLNPKNWTQKLNYF